MTEIRALWRAEFPPMPREQLDRICSAAGPALSQAACCFWLFRCLHLSEFPTAVLTGDYCFGRFSKHLSLLDSLELTDAFALFLKEDCLRQKSFGEYIDFINNVSWMASV